MNDDYSNTNVVTYIFDGSVIFPFRITVDIVQLYLDVSLCDSEKWKSIRNKARIEDPIARM